MKKTIAKGAKLNIFVIGAVLAGAMVILVISLMIISRGQEDVQSRFEPVGASRDAGEVDISPQYREVAGKHEDEEAERSREARGSHVPRFGGTSEIIVPDMPPPTQQYQQPAAVPPPPPPNYNRSYQQVSGERRVRMENILRDEFHTQPPAQQISVYRRGDDPLDYQDPVQPGDTTVSAAEQQRGAGPGVISQGSICYANQISPVNTDLQNVTVTAELLQCRGDNGDDLTGAMLFGEYDRNEDHVVVRYTMMNHAGQGYSINAVALDEETSSSVLSGDVNRHRFVRYWLPFLTEFASGFGAATGRQNTTVSISTAGISETQGEISDRDKIIVGLGGAAKVVQEIAQESIRGREITVTRPGNSTVGIVFLQDVR